MNTVLSVMNQEPIFCTLDTRVSEIKYLLQKYNYDEIVVLDSLEKHHPVGLVGMGDMSTPEIENVDIPSDVSAEECMRAIPAVVDQNSSLEECMNIMRANHLEHIPVVDLNGHFTGMLEKEILVKTIM
jgi:CBS domain-containing protein